MHVPDSTKAVGKKAGSERLRFELYHRLKASNLQVACLLNKDTNQVSLARSLALSLSRSLLSLSNALTRITQVHMLVSAGLQRLEREAEKAATLKDVRCNGGSLSPTL